MAFIENPDPSLKAKWGPLAHVTEEERQRILSLPAGRTQWEVKRLEAEIDAMEKRRKKRR